MADSASRHPPGQQAHAQRATSVVFVISQFLPLVGGAEVQALREAQALRAAGHDVRVLTLRWTRAMPKSETIQGVPVRRVAGVIFRGRLRLRFGMQWLAELAIWRELLRTRRTFEVIHLRQVNAFARPAALAAYMTRKPLFVRLGSAGPSTSSREHIEDARHLCSGPLDPHLPFLQLQNNVWVGGDIDSLYRTQRLAGMTMRLLTRRHVTFVATSTRLRSYLERHGVRPGSIALLPNGINLDDYAETAADVAARLEQPASDRPTVICVARLSYAKGVDVLLQAWHAVHGALPEARLLLIGAGELRPQMEAIANALQLGNSVTFAGEARDVRARLRESDVFVLPSRWEGMPNALIEAMACGLPSVATRVSGAEDLIVDGESGLLVPTGDPTALAEALLPLLKDRQRARAFGAAGRARIVQELDQRRLTTQLAALYARAMGNQAQPLEAPASDGAGSPKSALGSALHSSETPARPNR